MLSSQVVGMIRIPYEYSEGLAHMTGLLRHSYKSALLLFSLWFAGVRQVIRDDDECITYVFSDGYVVKSCYGRHECIPNSQGIGTLEECVDRVMKLIGVSIATFNALCRAESICYDYNVLARKYGLNESNPMLNRIADEMQPGLQYYAVRDEHHPYICDDECISAVLKLDYKAVLKTDDAEVYADGQGVTVKASVDGYRFTAGYSSPRFEARLDGARVYSMVTVSVKLGPWYGVMLVPSPEQSQGIAGRFARAVADAIAKSLSVLDSVDVECMDDELIARAYSCLVERGAITRSEACREGLRLKLEIQSAVLRHGERLAQAPGSRLN
ncbi:MAG: hypothetical protein QXY39_03390 [Thermofilaceae archaeon]